MGGSYALGGCNAWNCIVFVWERCLKLDHTWVGVNHTWVGVVLWVGVALGKLQCIWVGVVLGIGSHLGLELRFGWDFGLDCIWVGVVL